jgi:ankyrin repeat protein
LSPADSPIEAHSQTSPQPDLPKSQASLATELYHAACAGSVKQITLLLSFGAPVNTPTIVEGLYDAFKPAKSGTVSPLAGAAGHGHFDAVELLLMRDATINPTMKESSCSPLHCACKADLPEMAAYLLSYGADVNLQNYYSATPLMYAARYGSPPLVAKILEFKPNLHKLSFYGSTALHAAVCYQKDGDVLRLVLEAGADPDQAGPSGNGPLHLAVLMANVNAAEVLLEFGGDLARRNSEWKTALEVANEMDSSEMVKILEQNGGTTVRQQCRE